MLNWWWGRGTSREFDEEQNTAIITISIIIIATAPRGTKTQPCLESQEDREDSAVDQVSKMLQD